MFEKQLEELETRKRLLIAESELNRVLLVRECRDLAGGVHRLAQPVKYLGAFASSATVVLALYKTLRNGHSASPAPGRFWSIGNLLPLALGLWRGFRSRNNRMNQPFPLKDGPPVKAGADN